MAQRALGRANIEAATNKEYKRNVLQIITVVIGQRHTRSHIVRLSVDILVERDLWGLDGEGLLELEIGSLGQLASQPAEGLLEVVVALRGNIVVGHVLALVECDVLGLHTALLHIALVAHEHDGDVAAHTGEVAVPVGNAVVRAAGRHIEHEDGAVGIHATRDPGTQTALVTVSQSTESLLTSSIPAVEGQRTAGGVEGESVNLSTTSGYALTIHPERLRT